MVKLRRLGCDMQAGIFVGHLSKAHETYLNVISQVDEIKKKNKS